MAFLDLHDDERLIKIWREFKKIQGKITEELSGYAESGGFNEFIAEAWGEYMNNPLPRLLAKKIGDRIMEKYKARFRK